MNDFSETVDGDWTLHAFIDGVDQWFLGGKGKPPYIFIERVRLGPDTYTDWGIVARESWSTDIGPPLIAGPFPDLDAAKVAYLVLRTTLT